MIRVDGVTKSYGETTVLFDIDLEIPSSGITTIVGPNGAGKSTLLSVMSRLLPPDGGRVTVDDLDVFSTPSSSVARVLSILRQENHVTARITVRELVEFGRFPHSQGRLTADDRRHVDEALGYFDLHDFAQRPIHQLSGGQRQRAYVAMVMCQDTDYILLDEPLNNLDMKHVSEMTHLLKRLAAEEAKSIVMVLHDLNVAASQSDRIVAMRNGRIVHDGDPRSLMTTERLQEVYDFEIRVEDIDGQPVGLHFM